MLFFGTTTHPTGHGLLIRRFLDHTQRRITFGRISLGEWSARRRDLYLTTHNSHNKQTSLSPGGIQTKDPRRRMTA